MVKTPTSWTSNPNKVLNAVPYSSAAVQYSDPNTFYVSNKVSVNEFNKPSTAWTKATKLAAAWQFNTNYATNQYTYDSATFTYDSASQTYDGVNGTNSSISTKPLTSWTQVP